MDLTINFISETYYYMRGGIILYRENYPIFPEYNNLVQISMLTSRVLNYFNQFQVQASQKKIDSEGSQHEAEF